MIALDTNVLVHAHRQDAVHHARALEAISALVDGNSAWGVPWPCVHEFLGVVTHRRIYDPPTPAVEALEAVRALVALPTMRTIGEGPDHLDVLADLLITSGVTGPKVHDARIAAICLAHGVSVLWTADRDFSYFPRLRTHNPLVGSGP